MIALTTRRTVCAPTIDTPTRGIGWADHREAVMRELIAIESGRMGELLAGRYELVDPVGTGGTGAVWRIWDHRLHEYRAAKLLRYGDADSLLRFVRETSRRIEHTHVLAPDGWYGEDDRVLLTMPLARGGSLATLMNDFGPLPTGFAVELLRQVLTALAAIHEVDLVHRDLKPGNVLLDPTGTGRPHARLADFGTAAEVSAPRLTHTGTAIGTLGYMAPEQWRGADPAPAQDLYAAGVLGLQMLTGVRPPDDGSSYAPRLDLPGDSGQRISGWLFRLAADDPGDRPRDAETALAELAAIPGANDLLLGSDWAEPVEVFDQLSELPSGWNEQGPVGTPAAPEFGLAAEFARREPSAPMSGVAPSGVAPGGVAPSGVAPSGVAPSGVAPGGVGLSQVGLSGMGPSGAPHTAAPLNHAQRPAQRRRGAAWLLLAVGIVLIGSAAALLLLT